MYIDITKYSGDNHGFTFKLTIFYKICVKANISHEIQLKAFPTMLTGLALDYYYLKVNINTTVTVDKISNSIRTYFIRVKYKRSILSR